MELLTGVLLFLTVAVLMKVHRLEKRLQSVQTMTETHEQAAAITGSVGSISDESDIVKRYEATIDEYRQQGKDWAVNLVLRNAFVQHSDDPVVFRRYVEYLMGKVESAKTYQERFGFLDEAFNLLVTFSDYASLENFGLIEEYDSRIAELRNAVSTRWEKDVVDKNQRVLTELMEISTELAEASSEQDIRTCLEKASAKELELVEGALTEQQRSIYQELKESYEQLAAEKGEQLRQSRYNDYNLQVVSRTREVFSEFKTNEKAYRKGGKDVVDLVKDRLASVNTNYLSGETLMYFNQAYGYVFNKIDEEDKFNITRVMTEEPKDVVG